MLSGIQVEYCADKNYSPPGMALPSSVEAVATGTAGLFATGTAAATGTRTRAVFGPTGTSGMFVIYLEFGRGFPMHKHFSRITSRYIHLPSPFTSILVSLSHSPDMPQTPQRLFLRQNPRPLPKVSPRNPLNLPVHTLLYPSIALLTHLPASSSNTNDVGSSLLSTAAKTGIGIGVSACALLAFLIVLLILRRRRPPPTYYPPPPSYGIAPPPNMAPTPYSGNGPFSPPPIQQPIPMHVGQQQGGYAMNNMGDVSPIEEKAVPVVSTTPKVLRKEVGGGKLGRKSTADISVATPPGTPRSQQPPPSQNQNGNGNVYANETDGPREVHGSVPPQRHEVGNEGQITNTVSTRGMELDGQQLQPVANQYPGQQSYQQSAQGYPYYNPGTGGVPHEVDGGRNEWAQRQELAAGQWGRQELPGNSGHGRGGQGYGAPYEMPGR